VAELYTGSWQHSAALATLQLAHKIRRRAKQPSPFPPAEMALSAASLAAAYGRALRYDEALSTLRTIEPLTPSLPAQVREKTAPVACVSRACLGNSSLLHTRQLKQNAVLPV
jgi:hypothetical protein